MSETSSIYIDHFADNAKVMKVTKDKNGCKEMQNDIPKYIHRFKDGTFNSTSENYTC